MSSQENIYLNNAATSWPKPPVVADAVYAALTRQPGSANRGGIESFDVFDEVRRELARLMHIQDHRRIALGPNATWALNLAIFGFSLAEGDTVLTSKAEHNSVLRPLHVLEQRGFKVVYLDVQSDGRLDLREMDRALQSNRVRLLVFSQASNVTGAVNDAPSIIRLAHAYGAPVLLDVSQTLGWCDVFAGDWDADLVAFTGHKYLLGPQGTGGLYVAPNVELGAHLVGGTGIHSDLVGMPKEMPLRLEAGTGNEPSFYGLLAALRWAKENPLDLNVEEKKLTNLKNRLRDAGATVIYPEQPCTPVVSFVVDGYSPAEANEVISDCYDITIRTGLHCAPLIFEDIGHPGGTLRASLSRFTTDEEIDELIAAVADLNSAREER